MKTRIILALALLSLLCVDFVLIAGETKQEQIQKLIKSYQNQGTFNGSVLVAQKGEPLLSEGYGYSNLELQVENTSSTKFMIGSITKIFTATTVMKLIDQGKFSLDTKLLDILEWYRNDTGSKITVRHLLNHTSGIPNYFDMRGKSIYDAANEFGTGPIDKMEFARKYCQGDLEFEPGTKWNYNNTAYFLLGLIIEKATRKSYETALNEFIFNPLNMSSTGDLQPNPLKIVPNLANGYTRFFTDYSHAAYWNMSTTFGAGSIYSTVEDMLKFDRALYNEDFVSAAARETMFTPNMNNYGCGWELRESPVGKDKAMKKIRMHDGFLFAWHTRFYQIPEDQFLVVVFSNSGAAPIEQMVSDITDILYDRPVKYAKPLVAHEFWKSFKQGNLEQTIGQFQNCNEKEKNNWDYNEYHLNGLGYTILPTDQSVALKVFGFITEIYPQSWNAWDSYGEALAVAGKKNEAILAYEKSVNMNPENKAGLEMLKKLKGE